MSVYNYTGSGIFSAKEECEKKKLSLDNLNMINYEFDYKYANIFEKLINNYIKNPAQNTPSFKIRLLKKFIEKFVPFKKLKAKLREILKINKSKNSIELFYSDYKNNFGDILSYVLMDTFNNKQIIKNQNPRTADVSFIGSLLEVLMLNKNDNKTVKKPIKILGSGFIAPPGQFGENKQEVFCRPLNVVGLRGKISKARMEKILDKKLPNITLGDPGLLASCLLDAKGIIKQYDVGIIPHYVDINSKYLKNIKIKNILIIDITAPTQKVLRDIASCKFILSSAMHGLIAADSLLIPNRRIILSDKVVGGDYKFDDYYSIFNEKAPAPIDLREKVFSQKEIDIFTKEYHISPEEIKYYQEKIKKIIEEC